MTSAELNALAARVKRPWSVVLTVADHDKNGFVSLCKWLMPSQETAVEFIKSVDDEVVPDAKPDIKTASYTFILDLCEGDDTIDNGKRLLPTQVAMSLAPEVVSEWLNERPDPDSLIFSPIPFGPDTALKARARAQEGE